MDPLSAIPHQETIATWLCLAASAFLLFSAVWTVAKGIRSRSWPAVEGRVIRSVIEERFPALGAARGRAMFRPLVEYEYEVDGTRYASTQVSLAKPQTSIRAYAEKTTELYPLGRAVRVRYDPARPSFAVLEPMGWFGPIFMLFAAAAFGTVGVLLLLRG